VSDDRKRDDDAADDRGVETEHQDRGQRISAT